MSEWASPDTPWDQIAPDGTKIPPPSPPPSEVRVPMALPAVPPADSAPETKRKKRHKAKPGELDALIGQPRLLPADPMPALGEFTQRYFDEIGRRRGFADWNAMCVATLQDPLKAKVRHAAAIGHIRKEATS